MEEENIDKCQLKSRSEDDESKLFELEEALMTAREANERSQSELTRLRAEVSNLLLGKAAEGDITPVDQKPESVLCIDACTSVTAGDVEPIPAEVGPETKVGRTTLRPIQLF